MSEMEINGAGYVVGQFRGDNGENMVSHLYRGTFSEPGFPMCSRGWNRKWYDENGKIEDYEYSIFRGHTGTGICEVCKKRANAGLKPIEVPPNRRFKTSPLRLSKQL